MSEWADQPRPVHPDEILELARQFQRRWSVKRLARVGLHQHVREILWDLLDNGEFLLPTLKELEALTTFFNDTGATDQAFDAVNVADETPVKTAGVMTRTLQSVVKKAHFAWGRCYGLTNLDMGIKEDDDEPATTA